MITKNNYLYLTVVFLSSLLIISCGADTIKNRDSDEVVDTFRDYYNTEVMPYFNDNAEFGSFTGAEGKEIAYAKLIVENENGALVIFHGLGENYFKYAELAYDLRDMGYSIYIIDHRGHGNSERLLTSSDKDKRKNYVDSFDNYITDAKTFYDTVVNDIAHEKLFLIGHSMGGNIATQFV